MLGLRFCARAFSSCGKRGPLFIAVRGPVTIAGSLVAEHRLQSRRLSSCGSQAQSLRGMWDPPRPGLEPVSPALAGGFLTTAPPGKPPAAVLILSVSDGFTDAMWTEGCASRAQINSSLNPKRGQVWSPARKPPPAAGGERGLGWPPGGRWPGPPCSSSWTPHRPQGVGASLWSFPLSVPLTSATFLGRQRPVFCQ